MKVKKGFEFGFWNLELDISKVNQCFLTRIDIRFKK